MDREDVRICRALLMDSRTPYEELARTLDISVPAVHKRLLNLVRTGVISAFTAEVDRMAAGAASATVFGRSRLSDPSACFDALGKNDNTWLVLLGAGSMVYAFAHLRGARDLDAYTRFVTKAVDMEGGFGGLHSVRPGEARSMTPGSGIQLTPLEKRIIRSLQNDARKRASDVAEEIGVSAKTVNRKIKQMRDEHKVRFSIRWFPDYSNEIVFLLHLDAGPTTTPEKAIPLLMRSYPDNVVFCSAFQNAPGSIMATVWTETLRSVTDLSSAMSGLLGASSFRSNIIQSGRGYRSWKDRLVEE